MDSEADLLSRYLSVKERVTAAALRSDRNPEDVCLVAVSKGQPAEKIATLCRAGQSHFGESYIQEALAKLDALALPITWHFIGHLQTNKAKFITGRFYMLHSLDSFKLAEALNNRLAAQNGRLSVLIQVNLACECQKSGVREDELEQLAEKLLNLPTLDWQGLMSMPPLSTKPDENRPLFAKLRGLRDAMGRRFGKNLPQLSMGMSDDFEQAILEGATLVRVGTSIFGPRTQT